MDITRPGPRPLPILVGASLMLSLSMGMRQTVGLLLGQVTHDLGLLAADVTFAIALQNIVWGVTQPFVGAIADRWGVRPVTMAGAVIYVGGMALAASAQSQLALTVGLGLMIGLGLSCNGSSTAMSASARAVPDTRRSLVLGIVSAAGSVGTLLIAPLVQMVSAGQGWRAALALFAVLGVVMLPFAFLAGNVDRAPARSTGGGGVTMGETLRMAAASRPFLVMSAAYFVCGLQLVFLTTHLPTYLALCGMDPMLGAEALSVIGGANVVGSWLFGWLGGRYPKHILLGGIYMVRSISIAAYFVLPVTPANTLVFAAMMGLLWLGVVPLVSGLVAQAFGTRFMTTLVGIAFFSHQVGSFLGAWAGGLIYDALGSYDRAWQSAVAIGLVAGAAQITFGRFGPAARGGSFPLTVARPG